MPIYHPEALSALRAAMKENKIDYYLMTSSDCHASEYVSDYFKVTEFISGCTSDNVILIVGAQDAHLWTDGRYFISAAAELAGTGITLMKEGEKGVPSVTEWLKEHLSAGKTADSANGSATADSANGCTAASANGIDGENTVPVLGFDGRQVSAKLGASYRKTAAECGAKVNGEAALIDAIWTDRPVLPSHPLRVLPEEICGKTFPEKLSDLRNALKKEGADAIVLSKLDDIMWLTNIRGGDVAYNPVALSFALVTPDDFVLFIQENEYTADFLAYAKKYEIRLEPYENVYAYLRAYDFAKASASANASASGTASILCDSAASTDAMVQLLSAKGQLIDKPNPTELAKACKNEVEMENIRKYYLLDSAALCRFIYYVKKEMDESRPRRGLTEIGAARKLDSLRAQIPGFLDLSFPTIPAYGANAAMAHYAPEGEGAAVEPHGFLLVDSGGQYLGATTDVTRTIVVGDLTEQMKRDFTLVAASHFRLMNAVFKKGTTGNQLDMLAREPLFAYGLDYNHGTGHGIGYILNVHEGPQRIGSVRPGTTPAPMAEGMLTSDEPGIYRENEYGIRTESITLTVPHAETEFGTFLAFECLTWAPIDRDAIDVRYLSEEDRRSLNAYHEKVYEKIAPLLNEEERAWLYDVTRAI